MPVYEYRCCKCSHLFEVKHGMTETPLITCERCKKYICNRIISSSFAIGGDFDIDQYEDVRTAKPKWLKFHDGHREKLDLTKHGYRKGGESHLRKKKPKAK